VDSPDAKDGKNTTRTENITFNFKTITYTVDGITTCFDIATSAAC
jgi:hypothetical protein